MHPEIAFRLQGNKQKGARRTVRRTAVAHYAPAELHISATAIKARDFSFMASTEFSALRDQSLVVTEGLVAGQWTTAKDNKTFTVTNPATGGLLARCADLDRAAFKLAIQSAKHGTKSFFENTTAKERGSILRKWHDLVMANLVDSMYLLSLGLNIPNESTRSE